MRFVSIRDLRGRSADAGLLGREGATMEVLTPIKRAGADIISYAATSATALV